MNRGILVGLFAAAAVVLASVLYIAFGEYTREGTVAATMVDEHGTTIYVRVEPDVYEMKLSDPSPKVEVGEKVVVRFRLGEPISLKVNGAEYKILNWRIVSLERMPEVRE